MRRPTLRIVAIAAVAAGILGGVVAALAIPERSEGKREAVNITVLPAHKHIIDSGMVQLRAVAGSVRIEVRRADPLGGPPFAVRVFKAERLALRPGGKDLSKARVLGHPLCAQLGRIYRGRFGWIDARNRFRPAPIDYVSAPITCGDRWRDDRSRPNLQMTTLTTNPAAQIAAPRQTIAWGVAGGLATSLGLHGAAPAQKASDRGAFLAFVDAGRSPFHTTATVSYRGRPPITTGFGGHWGEIPGPPHGPLAQRIVPGSERVEARAPDPSGGLAWALTASRTKSGDWCRGNQPGRIVGDKVGGVAFGLGTFAETPPDTHCFMAPGFLTRSRPIDIGLGGNSSFPLDPEAEPAIGRTRLRTLAGRTYLTGTALPEVKEVTIKSPRDERTVIPSPRAHVFLVVYDGTFPTGELAATATLADGSHYTQRMRVGF